MRVPPAALLPALLLTGFPVPLSAGQTAATEELMELFDITMKVKAWAKIPGAAAGKRPSRETDLCRGRLPSDFAREQFVTPLTESRPEARRQEDAGHDQICRAHPQHQRHQESSQPDGDPDGHGEPRSNTGHVSPPLPA